MRTNRFALILLLSSIVFPALAQTQQGFVKTLGRPDKKGVALSGVSVRLKGGHNAVLSKDDGTFSMMMTGKKVGDAYSLQQVQKAGYELNEVGVIGRQYAFSDKVPLTIVMVSTSQLQADKQRIENNAYKVTGRNYKARLAQLEKDKEAGTISIETYRQEFQDLKDRFEKYQSLIDGLAEHYAHTDYDVLDEKECEINICIENGDLERADSLLHTIFDPIDVLKRNKEALTRIDQNLRQANDIMAQANADMAAVLKQQEKDAEYLYQLYTISTGKFDFEKAAYYIELRAELDTTNANWQFDAALYNDVQNQFHKAIPYYERTLVIFRQLVKTDPQTYEYNVAQTLNNIALIYSYSQRYEESETMLKEALEIYKRLAGTAPQTYETNIASILNNLSIIYLNTLRIEESETVCKEALETYKHLAQNDPQAFEPYVAAALNNLANLYSKTQRFEESEALYNESLEIRRRLAKENPMEFEPEVAKVLLNLANLYSDTGQLENSEEYYNEALEIYRRLAKNNPQVYEPNVASVHNNLAQIYYATHQFEKGETMLKEALAIRCRLADINPQEYDLLVAETMCSLASFYFFSQQRVNEADELFSNALEIFRRFTNDNPNVLGPRIAHLLGNLSLIGIFKNHFSKSEQYAQEGITADPTQHWIASNLAAALLFQGKYAEAETIYRQYKNEFKDGFLDDFKQFSEAGVIPEERKEDVERIKRVLNEE